ncbi:MAG: hypothetical protein M5U07_20335 [Xanthobacteraceae bacterium]|nr:hypothetical protein [Xanthobacteraceae bacterium]PWB64719.1 MAG: hypothetical protein C3F17_06265 [Bradyrhizobiaceae bacterium]
MSGARLPVRIAGLVAIAFGLLTIISGGRALFGDAAARAAVGAAVPFVLWFNFGAGFAYVAAGAGLLAGRPWSVTLSALIALATLLVFAAFGIHVLLGGAYEMRTVGAMTLRSVVWIVIAFVARRMPGRAERSPA